jgi:non-lysosomal glucosylceramidase
MTGDQLRAVRFPLGGIGTGTVSLGGRGELCDWEIFNRPAKGLDLPLTFFSIWARPRGGEPVARVLERRLQPPFVAANGLPRPAGLPRLAEATFNGEYPFAWMDFEDPSLPVQVSLEASNPMVPLDAEFSGMPVALLTWRLHNPGRVAVDATVALSLFNPCGWDGRVDISTRSELFGGNVSERVDEAGVRGLRLANATIDAGDPRHGTLAVASPWPDVTVAERWARGELWLPDSLQRFWDDFAADGRLTEQPAAAPSPAGQSDVSTLGLVAEVPPGGDVELPFALAWHFPNLTNEHTWGWEPGHVREPLGNHYATRWHDAWDVARAAALTMEGLRERTMLYHDALFSSSLPPAVLDAVSSQASIIRTTTCIRTGDGRLHGFEGCNDNVGCCPMNCTHVWNYEQSLAHLYPGLERGMRDVDFDVNLRESGAMRFRTILPVVQEPGWDWLPAADGQMGSVLKLYREWQLSGDDEFLRRLWPSARRALEFAWDLWDRDRDGVMEGEQHNTYDIEFHGPNTMVGSLYLAALKAGAAMASAVGDAATGETYMGLLERGREGYVDACWNGEYFEQRVTARRPGASEAVSMSGHSADLDDGEPPHQYGSGCLSDQVLGEWFAHVVGLGPVLDGERVRSALRAVHRHNWRARLDDHVSAQRTYALNDEAGLLLCSWPRGGRPARPFPYSDEVWTGVEYQVAAHLIYEGMVDEGLQVVEGLRARYDGERRNPWDELECGHHYARAMASWSLLLALSGFSYSAPEKRIGFDPRINADDFRCLFTTGTAWGLYSQQVHGSHVRARVEVREGRLELRHLRLGARELEMATPAVVVPGSPLEVEGAGDDGLAVVATPGAPGVP